MEAYKHLLLSALAVAFGIAVTYWSTIPFFASDIGWFYQLVIGLVMMVVGGWSCFEIGDCSPRLFPGWLYNWCGAPLLIAGILVVLNFNRYAEILSKTGAWPIYLIGGWITFTSVIVLVHYLTVFEQPEHKTAK